MTNAGLGPFKNILNAFMDDCEDGFYTCMKREARFPALVYLGGGGIQEYEIKFAATAPEKMTFKLKAEVTTGVIIHINYARSNSYSVFKDGNLVDPEGWAEGGGTTILKAAMKPVTGVKGCGENNYEGGAVNKLTFFISPDSGASSCELTVMPRNVIQLGVRLEFTVVEFFFAGGVTTFTHRMASLLEIHFADIRIVSIYEGSTIVQFEVY